MTGVVNRHEPLQLSGPDSAPKGGLTLHHLCLLYLQGSMEMASLNQLVLLWTGCLYIPIHTTELYTGHTVMYNHIHNNTSQYNMYCNVVICIMPSCYIHHSLSDCQCNIRNTSTKHDQAPAAGGVSSTGRDLSCAGWPMVTLDPGMFAEPNASLETGSSGVAVASGCSSPATSKIIKIYIRKDDTANFGRPYCPDGNIWTVMNIYQKITGTSLKTPLLEAGFDLCNLSDC